jgi:hypothetical protein
MKIAFLYRLRTADTLNWLFLVSCKWYWLEEPTRKMVYQSTLRTIFILVTLAVCPEKYTLAHETFRLRQATSQKMMHGAHFI